MNPPDHSNVSTALGLLRDPLAEEEQRICCVDTIIIPAAKASPTLLDIITLQNSFRP